MNVDLIFQIAGVGIIVAVLNQLLTRAGRDEQALLTAMATRYIRRVKSYL